MREKSDDYMEFESSKRAGGKENASHLSEEKWVGGRGQYIELWEGGGGLGDLFTIQPLPTTN